MKRLLIALSALLMLSVSACHQSDGYIGDFYGVWLMDACTIDGKDAPIELERYSWRFQADIVMITRQIEAHNYVQYVGNWSESDDMLTLKFYDKQEGGMPPKDLLLDDSGLTQLKIVKLSGRHMLLRHNLNFYGELVEVEYELRKLN